MTETPVKPAPKKSSKYISIDEFLTRAEVALTNAQGTPEIKSKLAALGYTDQRFQEGMTLLQTAKQRHADQVREYGEQYEATQVLGAARKSAENVYDTHRGLVKLLLVNDAQRQHKLAIPGRRKHSFSAWLGQAEIFYTNLLADTQLVGEIDTRYKVTREMLEQGLEGVRRAAEVNAQQEKEKYEAQSATKARDEALDDLEDWLDEFRGVAEIALADNPQQLEALQFGAV